MSAKPRELSWSLSRARAFEGCPRQLYYQSYLAPKGYYPDAPEEARLALEMKSIQSLDMWVGDVVHQTIQWALVETRDGRVPSAQQAKDETRRRLSEGWQGSRKQLWRTTPDDVYPNLFDHYYALPVSQDRIDRIKNKAFLSIGNFMDSDILRRIARTPTDRWLPIEKYASFRLDGLLMYVKFDFALKDGERLVVYDWKTGAPAADECRQLACYALYTSAKWNVPISHIAACPVHLQPVLEADERSVTDEDIDDTKAYVSRTFQDMLTCLRDPARNIAVLEDFPVASNPGRCLYCSFRGICDQSALASGTLDDYPLSDDLGE